MKCYLKAVFFIFIFSTFSYVYADDPLRKESIKEMGPAVSADNAKDASNAHSALDLDEDKDENGPLSINSDFQNKEDRNISGKNDGEEKSGSEKIRPPVKKEKIETSEQAFTRDVLSGDIARQTVKEKLQNMADAFLNSGGENPKRMAEEVRKMTDFLERSLTSAKLMNKKEAELVVNKRRDNSQVSTVTAIDRDGMMAVLRIVYPKEGNVPSNVVFRPQSIFREDGSVSLEFARRYIEQYANLDGRMAAEEALGGVRRDKKILGIFEASEESPGASYLSLSFMTRVKGVPKQIVLKIFGDGHVTVSENEAPKLKTPAIADGQIPEKKIHIKKKL